MSFANGRPPLSPAQAQQDHLDRTLEKHGVLPLHNRTRVATGLASDLGLLRLRQQQLYLLDELDAVGCVEDAIEAVEEAQRKLGRGGRERLRD